jgi:hypothetical protein
MAAAGREAAGMARRLTDRFLDRASVRRLPFASSRASAGLTRLGQPSAFVTRFLSDQSLQKRLGAVSSQVTDLLTHSASAPTRRRPILPSPALPSLGPFRKKAQGTRQGAPNVPTFGMQAAAFRPVSFPSVRPTPSPAAMPTSFAPSLLRPHSALAETEVPTATTSLFGALPEIRLPADNAASSPQSEGLGILTPSRRREEASTDETPEANTDYRLLGPTALRDTLRQRGGRGMMLDFSLRERLHGTLGFDPAMARLHRGPAAGEAARSLRAQAFTIGQDVFFGEGRFDTTSRAGLELLTHELTHVGQQTRTAQHQTRFFTAQGGDSQEEEAQRTAARLMIPAPHFAQASSGVASQNSWAAPEMQLAMPPPPASRRAMGANAPIQRKADPMAGGHGGASSAQAPRPQPLRPQAVADHVYELMKQELMRGRRRGI